MSDLDRAKIWLETTKTLLQIISALVVGVFVSSVTRAFLNARKVDRALHDYRLGFLNELQSAYQRVKRSRRVLRATGLTTKFGAQPITMSPIQVTTYGEQMDVLNEAQLELERLIVEVGNFPDAFSEHKQLTIAISSMESYIRSVLEEYEKRWPQLATVPGNVNVTVLEGLNDLAGPYSGSRFRTDFADRYDDAIGYMREELLPLKRAVKDQA